MEVTDLSVTFTLEMPVVSFRDIQPKLFRKGQVELEFVQVYLPNP
jgi:hypothetical protein